MGGYRPNQPKNAKSTYQFFNFVESISLFCLHSLILFFTVTTTFQVHADNVPRSWTSPSLMGSGSSATAWADDDSAIFFNPAGITYLNDFRRKSIFQKAELPFPGMIGGNTLGINSLMGDYKNAFYNMIKNSQSHETNGLGYNTVYTEAEAFPDLVFGWGKRHFVTVLIGAPARSELKVAQLMPFLSTGAKSGSYATYVDSVSTASGVLGLGYASRLGLFRMGVSARPNMRYDYENVNYSTPPYSPATSTTNSLFQTIKQDAIVTSALGIDAGFTLSGAYLWFPTLGVSVINIPTGCSKKDEYFNPLTQTYQTVCGSVRKGRTTISKTDPNTSKVDPMELHAGVAITPRVKIHRTVLNLRLSGDIYPIPVSGERGYYGVFDEDLSHFIHAGGTLFFGNALDEEKSHLVLRGGVMNGYGTWGATLKVWKLKLSYLSFVAHDSLPESLKTTSNNVTSISKKSGVTNNYFERRQSLSASLDF